VLQEKPEDWDNVIETQLNAVFLLSKLAARSMVSNKGGKIINIGSMYSFFGSGLVPSYSAAKGAIVQLTKSMAIELAPHNIQVNAIAPGWIATDMTAPVRAMPMNDEILARTPPVDGANRKNLPEQPCTWPRGHRTSLPVLRSVSMAVMRSDDIPNVTLHASDAFSR
jgi:2-deoxy-D-gluconate 3-dehydrogenase